MIYRIYCLGCGETATGASPKEAWKKVQHDGHGHAAENMNVAEALGSGKAEGWWE